MTPFPQPGPVEREMRERAAAARARLMGRAPRLTRVSALPKPVEPELVADVPVNMLTRPGWRVLLKLAAVRHDVTVDDILGPLRTAPIVDARYEAMHLIWRHCNAKTAELTRMFKRDQKTIWHALRTIERRRDRHRIYVPAGNKRKREQGVNNGGSAVDNQRFLLPSAHPAATLGSSEGASFRPTPSPRLDGSALQGGPPVSTSVRSAR